MPIKKTSQLTIPHFAAYFLIVVTVILLIALLWIYWSFWNILIFATLFATIFSPVYKKLNNLFGEHRRIASIVTCILVMFVIVIPLGLFITLLIHEGINAFTDIVEKLNTGFFNQYTLWWKEGNFLHDQYQSLLVYIDSFSEEEIAIDSLNFDVIGQITANIAELTKDFASTIKDFLANMLWLIFSFFIFFFSLYYFLKDGDMIAKKITELSPLPKKYENAIFKKFKEVTLAMLFGIFFTAIIQGTLAGIGYTVVGVPNPIFWAAATALFSLVPLFGTATIWAPTSAILMITGNVTGGVGLMLWGMMVVATVDNFIRPYLIEGRAPVHPLLTFLAVLGGLFTFGLKGIIYGPLILNLLFAFLHIYEMEYAKVLKH